MYIDGITISGADDAVDPARLYDLSYRYPFVEWGILHHPEKSGSERYPSDKWIEKFDTFAPRFVRRAIHLCGGAVDQFCSGDLSVVRNAAYHDPTFDRVQVNLTPKILAMYSPSEIARLLIVSNSVVPTIIQANDITLSVIVSLTQGKDPEGMDVQILIDESRGKGKSLGDMKDVVLKWGGLFKTSKCGFAGGIVPANIEEVIRQVESVDNSCYDVKSVLTGEQDLAPSAWIDLESGARTRDAFDLDKVELLLKEYARCM
jgi:phosphoribosylanthranilate isomerase